MVGSSSRVFVHSFSQRLLIVDLPGLDRRRRDEVADFTVRRVDELPSVLRLGVSIVAAVTRGVLLVPGSNALLGWLIDHPLPIVGEYVRMIRSLAYTYVWETWPDTLPDGAEPIESERRSDIRDGVA